MMFLMVTFLHTSKSCFNELADSYQFSISFLSYSDIHNIFTYYMLY